MPLLSCFQKRDNTRKPAIHNVDLIVEKLLTKYVSNDFSLHFSAIYKRGESLYLECIEGSKGRAFGKMQVSRLLPGLHICED